jgi:hypothetical protein
MISNEVFDIKREEHREDISERGVAIIFGRRRHDVRGGWRKLHNEQLHNLYVLPSIIIMIKSRRMRKERTI